MTTDLAVHIEAVARRLFGEPNRSLSPRTRWGYGSHDLMAVEVAGEHRGTWFDTEINERERGGGVSLRLTKAVWECSKAKGPAKLVLLCLAEHANDDGLAWPSQARLARMCCVDERNIRRARGNLPHRRPGGADPASQRHGRVPILQ